MSGVARRGSVSLTLPLSSGRMRRVLAAVVVLPLALALVTACDEEEKASKAAAGKSCEGVVKPADPAARPADLPGPSGLTYYDKVAQGKTTIYFATLKGDHVVPARDAAVAALKGAGYTVKGTDAEADAEAEAEFTGPHDGSVQVVHLCQGTLRVRWRLES